MLPDLRFVIGAVLATTMLGVVSIGVFTTFKLGPQNRAGPLESSRYLGFDDRADWNQFYDSEAGRRFEELAFKVDAADILAKRSADEPLQVTSPVAAAGAGPEGAAEQAAETTRGTAQDLPVQQPSEYSTKLSPPLAAADAPVERAPGQTAAVAKPRQIAAEIEARDADQAPLAPALPRLRGRDWERDGVSNSLAPELATAAPVPAPLLESSIPRVAPAHIPPPHLTPASPSPLSAAERLAPVPAAALAPNEAPPIAAPIASTNGAPAEKLGRESLPGESPPATIKAASAAADEPRETAALAPSPAAAASSLLWQDEPLFIVEDDTESASTADSPAAAPASDGVTGSVQEKPPAVKAPAVKRIVPRARKLAPTARTIVRAPAPVRIRATPPRRRVATPRRSAPRSQFDQQFSGESFFPDNYAPRQRAPRRPSRRQQQQDDPFGGSFGPPAGAYGG
jgi:hypothetical protein